MAATLDIPQQFTVGNTAQLKLELERLAKSLDLWTRGAGELFAPRYSAIPQVNPTALQLGYVARVNLIDGDSLRMQMPPNERKNYGKRCAILRQTLTGVVTIFGGPALIGGADRYQLANDIHYVEFLLDDGDWYPSRAGAAFE